MTPKRGAVHSHTQKSLMGRWIFKMKTLLILRPENMFSSHPLSSPSPALNLSQHELVMPSNHLILGRPLLLPPSIFPSERLLLNKKTPGFLASGGEEFNPGPETRLDRSELLCNKVLLKDKGDRESFWYRNQKGAERVLVFSWMLCSHQQSVNERKECLKTQNGTRTLTHNMHFGIILAPDDSSWAKIRLTWML